MTTPPEIFTVVGVGSAGVVRPAVFEVIGNYTAFQAMVRGELGREDALFGGAGLDVDRNARTRGSLYSNPRSLISQLDKRDRALKRTTGFLRFFYRSLTGPKQFNPEDYTHDEGRVLLVDLEGDKRDEILNLFENNIPGQEYVESKNGNPVFCRTPYLVSYEFLAGEPLPLRVQQISADTARVARHMMERREKIFWGAREYLKHSLGEILTPPDGIDLSTPEPSRAPAEPQRSPLPQGAYARARRALPERLGRGLYRAQLRLRHPTRG